MTEFKITGSFLCTDLLLDVFQYFYVDELFHSFNDIIYHLPSLLEAGNVQLHIRHINTHFRKHILPYIEIKNVISIRVQNMYQMARVNLGQFNEVRLLILHNVTSDNWPCHFPNKLRYLTIYVRSKEREKVFKKALSLENIERLEFNSTFLHFHDCKHELPKPSTIKHLTFNSQRCFLDYQFLLTNVPYLRSLKSINTYYPHRFKTNLGSFPYLHTINLVCKHIDIDTMILLLTNLAVHSLHRCRLVNIKSSLSSCIANVLISC